MTDDTAGAEIPDRSGVPECEGVQKSEARRGGVAGAVQAGTGGESITAGAVLETIGGWRGVVETMLPPVVFLAAFIFTRDARTAAIAPLAIALIAFVLRLIAKQPVQAALSGLVGVLVCAGVTMFTGRGEDYYLPGFWINAVWCVAYVVSILVGWPLIGLLLGFLRGSLTDWRRVPVLRRASTVCSLVWAALFASRLAVQLPLYFAAQEGDEGAIDALGLARLLMGVPLFALAVILTWLVLSRVSAAVDAAKVDPPSSDE